MTEGTESGTKRSGGSAKKARIVTRAYLGGVSVEVHQDVPIDGCEEAAVYSAVALRNYANDAGLAVDGGITNAQRDGIIERAEQVARETVATERTKMIEELRNAIHGAANDAIGHRVKEDILPYIDRAVAGKSGGDHEYARVLKRQQTEARRDVAANERAEARTRAATTEPRKKAEPRGTPDGGDASKVPCVDGVGVTAQPERDADGARYCPYHGVEMMKSKAGGWFCPAKPGEAQDVDVVLEKTGEVATVELTNAKGYCTYTSP